MICDLNLVLSPEYPNVSTALVIAVLVKAIDAPGHNCPPIKLSTHWTVNRHNRYYRASVAYDTPSQVWKNAILKTFFYDL